MIIYLADFFILIYVLQINDYEIKLALMLDWVSKDDLKKQHMHKLH